MTIYTHMRILLGLMVLAPVLGCGSQAGAGDAERKLQETSELKEPADTLLPESNYYAIDTPMGQMVIRLLDETPVHRDNFKKLVARGFYDGTMFHRVIEGFMIQGGDPTSRDGAPEMVGQGGPGYTLEAEIIPGRIHRRGAVAAARQGDAMNPERRSSGSQFYIVHGRVFDDELLDMQEARVRQGTGNPTFRFSDRAREVYTAEGGAPHLDGQYTIFGELVEGFEVLERIATLETPNKLGQDAPPYLLDRPLREVYMRITPVEREDAVERMGQP